MHQHASAPSREKEIYRITILGSVVNVLLTVLKFVAGVLGASTAMIADAVHSLSDLLTDFVVLLFVKLSSRPADTDHPYGHGKYETLATAIVAIALLAAGGILLVEGVEKIIAALQGEQLVIPGRIALWAALISIVAKETVYWLTVAVAKRVDSSALKANSWHHRTDALSSVATAFGIGGALLLGGRWAILDPIAAVLVSIFIIVTAAKLLYDAVQDLLEKSLPEEVEQQIGEIVNADSDMSEMHHLRTRRVGSVYSIEMHLRMRGSVSLYEAHQHSMLLEQRLRERFGADTLITIHLEPLKVNGVYQPN
ncbi:MAG: cation transporter [Paludibacteraceae bacterium]|nr:cation transporter [Paludibacteraceae bacterium]